MNDHGRILLQKRLLEWFDLNKRDFPWRQTHNPFAILVAEKLLQQTRAREGVEHAFRTLISRYPDPEALANADITTLETIIYPLGLVYRAGELKSMAKEIVEIHGGQVPKNLRELMKLTGVGSYSARAVLSFAFGEDVAVVDTNVARILHRVFGITDPMPANPARKSSLLELANSLIPTGKSRALNLAMLDLGSLVCTAASPECLLCPLLSICTYGQKLVADS